MADLIDLSLGGTVLIDEGEAADINAVLESLDEPFDKASLLSLTVTRRDSTGAIINGRDGQDILDKNNGSVDDQGNFKLELGPLDNPFNGTGSRETHTTVISWEWANQSANQRTGSQTYLTVVAASVPADPGQAIADVGWLG